MNPQAIISALSKLQFKNDKALIAFATFLVAATMLALKLHYMTGKEAGYLLVGALSLPGLFGRKNDGSPASTDDTPKPPSGTPPPAGPYRTNSDPSVTDSVPTLPSIPAAPDSGVNVKRSAWLIPMPVAAAMLVIGSLFLGACKFFTADNVKTAEQDTSTALTVLQEACVIANAAFAKSVIADACHLSGPYLDFADKLLMSTKGAGAVRMRPFPVTCEDGDAGIVCEQAYVTDAGAAQ